MLKLCQFNFEFDDFQKEAISNIESNKSVVVCAPTGAGKTVIAEYAVNLALKANKRLFYTTPLKALSNQKFHDFKVSIGEENVGLLTGDVSINRDAAVVVMTTEVFRNMLYGTNFGKVDDNMNDVMFVVLDECHYMNDAERGTVWEESIIYCPKNIQIIALSATVANAQELTGWINTIHRNTALINSDFRPVPLRNFYFINNQLVPLISPGSKINQQIKKLKIQRGKNFRKNVQSPLQVVKVLDSKDMLPAIYFCFSRKKCDEFMMQTSKLRLLNNFEEKRLGQIIDEYILDNPSLAKNKHLEYVYSGVASHHAGLLPNWKYLIEKLFQQGLIKVVFATETLAAGINMPARTTVISDISKPSEEGHRKLTASEFLQMSGRAGRRGMDKIGYVVSVASPFHSSTEVAQLALSQADPLNSQFTPTYSMVLNLLQRFSLEHARELILNSFGYYNTNVRLSSLYDAKDQAQQDFNETSNFYCPYNLSNEDLIRYQKNKEKYLEIKRIFNMLKKQAKRSVTKEHPEIEEYYNNYKTALSELERIQCYKCDVYKLHLKNISIYDRLNKRLKEIDKIIEHEKDLYWNQFLNLVRVLTDSGYLKNDFPTELGLIASTLRCKNEFYITQVLNSGVLDDLAPPEIAAIICSLITEDSHGNQNLVIYPGKSIRRAVNQIAFISKEVLKLQKKHKVVLDTPLNLQLSASVEIWTSGAEWDTVLSHTSVAEGDIVRTLKRTVDMLRQVIYAPYINPELTNKCRIAMDSINREPVIDII